LSTKVYTSAVVLPPYQEKKDSSASSSSFHVGIVSILLDIAI